MSTDRSVSYEYCASVDREVLGRRALLGLGTLVLYAERFVAGDSPRWELDQRLMERALLPGDPDPYPAIGPDEAAELAGGAGVLGLPPAVSASEQHYDYIGLDARLAWLNETIDRTVGAIDGKVGGVISDLMFSSFGDEDYDYAHDELAWMKQAYATIEALMQERDVIRSRQQLRKRADPT